MKIRNAWALMGFSVVVLAGCQSEAVKFQIKDQRVPEQVGLRVDWIRDYGREGVLKDQPTNIGRAYRQNGELGFRSLRVTNNSAETREIYPVFSSIGEEAAVQLSQVYYGLCERTSYACEYFLSGPQPPQSELLSEYRSEFDLIGAEFVFDSGGKEVVPVDSGKANPKPVAIRAGESAVLVLRMALRPGFPIIPSDPDVSGQAPGNGFMPPHLNIHPQSRVLRTEWLVGVSVNVRPTVSILARNPKTDELNALYLGANSGPGLLYTEGASSTHVAFPPPKVARVINGLADQI